MGCGFLCCFCSSFVCLFAAFFLTPPEPQRGPRIDPDFAPSPRPHKAPERLGIDLVSRRPSLSVDRPPFFTFVCCCFLWFVGVLGGPGGAKSASRGLPRAPRSRPASPGGAIEYISGSDGFHNKSFVWDLTGHLSKLGSEFLTILCS